MRLPKPFEMPVEIAGVDCTAVVRVISYEPERMATYYEPSNGEHVEFSVESLTAKIDGQMVTAPVSVELHAILDASDEIRIECRDRIEDANQPPECK